MTAQLVAGTINAIIAECCKLVRDEVTNEAAQRGLENNNLHLNGFLHNRFPPDVFCNKLVCRGCNFRPNGGDVLVLRLSPHPLNGEGQQGRSAPLMVWHRGCCTRGIESTWDPAAAARWLRGHSEFAGMFPPPQDVTALVCSLKRLRDEQEAVSRLTHTKKQEKKRADARSRQATRHH